MTRTGLLVAWMIIGFANGAGAEIARQPPTDLAKLAERLGLTDKGVWRWLERLGVTRDDSTTQRLLAVDLTGKVLFDRRARTHRFAWIRSWTICCSGRTWRSSLFTTTRRASA